MARTARKLSLAPAPRSAERVALAAAAAHHAAAVHRLETNAKSQEATAASISNARDVLAAATEALEKAKTNAAEQLAGVLRRPPKKSIAAARAELEAATDTLEAALASEMILTTQQADAEQAVLFARMSLDRRIRDAVQSDAATRKLLADFEHAHRKIVGLRNALRFLDGKNLLPDDAKLWACERDDWPEQSAETARWKSWIAALSDDADATI